MTPNEANAILANASVSGLDEISIENLKGQRITQECVAFIRQTTRPAIYDVDMADGLNELLEAGRVVRAAEFAEVRGAVRK